MNYEKMIIRSASRHSTSSSSSNAIYQLANPFVLKTNRLKLKYFQMYNTKYQIDSSNNKIDFNENSTNKTATLTTGYYTGSSLATEIATQLTTTSAGYNTFSGSYSNTTKKITITAGNAFTLLFLTGTNTTTSPFKECGFVSSNGLTAVDSSTGTSVTAPYPVNLSLPLSYFIDVDVFGNYNNKTSDGLSFTFYIPNNSSSGGLIEYIDDAFSQIIDIPPSLNYLDRFKIRIYQGNKVDVDLQNSDYEMILEQV